MMASVHRSRTLCLLLFESLCAYLCGAAAIYLRFGAAGAEVFFDQGGWHKTLLVMAVVQGALYLFDLYDLRLIRRRATLYARLLQAIGAAAIALAALFYLLPHMLLGRGVFALGLLLMLTLMACWRLAVMWLLGLPRFAERVLILGTGPSAVRVAGELLDRREDGYQVIGFVGDDPALLGRSLINPRVVGLAADLEGLAEAHHAERIIVAVSDRRGQLPLDLLLRLRLRGEVAVEESSAFFERLTGKISLDMVRPSNLIFSDCTRWQRLYARARRLADVLLSLAGLALSLPVMAAAAAAIKLDSPGPVFYRQERVGRNGRRFHIVKFRSMRPDAEKDGPVWAAPSDPRITRVGRVIRKLRVDELPQFVNVLRGDMSFIGPRPERPAFVERLEREVPYYAQRHLVKPGLTGWAQIRYPYGASVEDAREKLQYDLFYIKNQSAWLDAIILFETVRIVLLGRGGR